MFLLTSFFIFFNIFIIIISIFEDLINNNDDKVLVFFMILNGILSIIITFFLCKKMRQNLKQQKYKLKKIYSHLFSLKEEVEKHNQIIEDIDILDELEAAGNPINLSNREDVISTLSVNKDNIIHAIKTERILRENSRFRPENFNIDITALKSLQISEQAGEYGEVLNNALSVAMNVQKEMDELINRR